MSTPEDNPADDVQPTKEEWEAYEASRNGLQPPLAQPKIPPPPYPRGSKATDEELAFRRLRNERDELLEQLRCQTKSFCTHCGKLFSKGAVGIAEFREHIAECNSHPMQPLAAALNACWVLFDCHGPVTGSKEWQEAWRKAETLTKKALRKPVDCPEEPSKELD